MRKFWLALLLCAVGSTGAIAQEPQFQPDPKNIDVNIFGHAHHKGGTHNGKLNENNYGLGLRYNFSSHERFGLTPFVEVDAMRNSQRGLATILGTGVKNDHIIRFYDFSFGAAIGVAHVSYENPNIHRTMEKWTPAGYLSFGYRDKVFLNLAPVTNKAVLWSLTFRKPF